MARDICIKIHPIISLKGMQKLVDILNLLLFVSNNLSEAGNIGLMR